MKMFLAGAFFAFGLGILLLLFTEKTWLNKVKPPIQRTISIQDGPQVLYLNMPSSTNVIVDGSVMGYMVPLESQYWATFHNDTLFFHSDSLKGSIKVAIVNKNKTYKGWRLR